MNKNLPILATHDFFNAAINSRKVFGGWNSNVLAAGEFIMRDGLMILLNNQSGSFRGSSDHLKYAKGIFAKLHFPFSDKMVIEDAALIRADTAELGHANAEQEVQAHLAIDIDPLKSEQFLKTQQLMKLASTDIIRITGLLMNEVTKELSNPDTSDKRINALSSALFILGSWDNPHESEAYLTLGVLKRNTRESFQDVLDEIHDGIILASIGYRVNGGPPQLF